LGIDVPKEMFVEGVRWVGANILAMSALLA